MSYRVLLVDDEIHILRAAEFKFKRANFDVVTATDGQEAWEIMQSQIPDVLITDYHMPRMDGIELIQQCRQYEPTKDLPILMLTAKGFELSHHELAARWGIRGVISKPFSPRELLKTVENIVIDRSKRSDIRATNGSLTHVE